MNNQHEVDSKVYDLIYNQAISDLLKQLESNKLDNISPNNKRMLYKDDVKLLLNSLKR